MFSINNYLVSSPKGIMAEEYHSIPENEWGDTTMKPADQKTASGGVHLLSQVFQKIQQMQHTLNTEPTASRDNIDERILVRHQCFNGLYMLARYGVTLTTEQQKKLYQILIRDTPEPFLRTNISDADIWEMVANKISIIGDGYLGVYENVVAVYTDFYQDFSNILSKMGGWLLPGKDGNSVKLDVTSLISEIKNLIREYEQVRQKTVLFPPQTEGSVTGATEAEARQWIKELNLPEHCLKSVGSGYVVTIDLTPVHNMLESVKDLGTPGADSKLEMDNAKYQAWQSGFKAQEENMKTTLQTLTQKYSNANSLYDNLIKILSSTISSCMETAKSFLQR
ncbi:IpaD/SipD/SspD family type III secretion system needle tip protein [Salmonella enterica]|nr:IpaD/SipD/SspD family type III secretion system needle tip protein [Salmonella enterica]